MRSFDAFPIVRFSWFAIYLCATWFFGYQTYRTMMTKPSHKIMICVIPFIAIEFGIWRCWCKRCR